MYICIHMNSYIYEYIYTYVNVLYMNVDVCACLCAFSVHVCICVFMCLCVIPCIHIPVRKFVERYCMCKYKNTKMKMYEYSHLLYL